MKDLKKVACIIPARLASSRFPGKPLAKILGHSMIEHVYRRVKLTKRINEVCIATCDEVIALEAKRFGCSVIMTKNTHTRGTDRVAEAASQLDADLIINVQGDEPLVDPESLDRAIEVIKSSGDIFCANLVSKLKSWEEFISTNVVKTVIGHNDMVLYFSRQPIPTSKQDLFKSAIKQIGIYFFQRDLLMQYASWSETPLEIKESVDMMRFIENGIPIKAIFAEDMMSVDTPQELTRMEQLLSNNPLTQKLFSDTTIPA